MFVKIAGKYADDVVTGTIPACLYVRQACQRFIDDLARDDLELNHEKAEDWCVNFQKLPHVKGPLKGKLIHLEPWQIFILVNLFGWYWTGTNNRRFREFYGEVPRKNTKSTMAAGIGIGMFTWDSEPTPEIVSGATSEEQAWYIYGTARQMCLSLPKLRKTYNIEVNAKTIVSLSDLSRFVPIIGNPGDGGSATCGLVDEYHEHKSDDLADTIQTGQGTRLNPMMVYLTTAGSDMGGPCYTKRADVISILSGAVVDDRVCGIIYTIDEDDQWDTVDALKKANPNYGVSVSADFLEGQLKQARRSPSKQSAYKTKHLNMWVGAKAAWMNMLAFQACRKKDLNIEEFKDRPCYLAVDLATKTDIAAVMTLFPPENGGKWAAFGRYYLPEDTINDNPRYQGFHAGGWLQATSGNIIDYEVIENDIIDMRDEYQIKEIPYDPFQATYFVTRMQSQGFPMVDTGATIKNFSDPMMTLEALILAKEIEFQMDPVLLWMFGNVVAKTTMNKAKEVIFPDKERAESKIDGVVALIMALNRALPYEQEKTSVYDTRGILSFDNTATAPAIIESNNAPI